MRNPLKRLTELEAKLAALPDLRPQLEELRSQLSAIESRLLGVEQNIALGYLPQPKEPAPVSAPGSVPFTRRRLDYENKHRKQETAK